MTEYFSQEQIAEIRECFNVFSQDGLVHSVPQLRCILRSLGYTPTAIKTIEYFNSQKATMDFASFLEIARKEHDIGNGVTEVVRALKVLDRNDTRVISARELRSILATTGERMSQEEIEYILQQIAIGEVVSHQKLIQFISN